MWAWAVTGDDAGTYEAADAVPATARARPALLPSHAPLPQDGKSMATTTVPFFDPALVVKSMYEYDMMYGSSAASDVDEDEGDMDADTVDSPIVANGIRQDKLPKWADPDLLRRPPRHGSYVRKTKYVDEVCM